MAEFIKPFSMFKFYPWMGGWLLVFGNPLTGIVIKDFKCDTDIVAWVSFMRDTEKPAAGILTA